MRKKTSIFIYRVLNKCLNKAELDFKGDNMESSSQKVSTGEKILNFLVKLPQYVGAIIKFIFFLAVTVGGILLVRACS
nr:MAG TPA: hypothetical protein [Caudoviricetes sp.]